MYFRNLPIITAGVFFFSRGKALRTPGTWGLSQLGSVKLSDFYFLLTKTLHITLLAVSGTIWGYITAHCQLSRLSHLFPSASIVCPISHFVYVVCCLFHMSISLHIIIDLIILYIICIDSVINGIKVSGVLFCLVTTYVDFSPSIAVKSSVFCGIG